MVVLGFVAFLLVCLTVDAVIQYKKQKEAAVNGVASVFQSVFDESKLIIPKGLFFDKTHTWAYMDKYGSVKIGINDLLQHITGPITSISMKNTGEKIKKGDLLLSIIQKGKKLNIYSPVTGKIKTSNSQLNQNSSIINSSPYSDGWVYDIEPENWLKESKLMMMAEKANDWIKYELIRFKDFLAVIQSNNLEYANVIMQDGGALNDAVLAEMGPEVWEDFQTNFIDKGE